MTGQRTTAEQRAALRARYTRHPDWWMLGSPAHLRGDPDVLAAVDDADALAGALERSAALERGIARQKELQLETNGVALGYLLRATRAEESLAGARAAVGRYRAALTFYADPTNWRCEWMGPPPLAWRDRGEIARAALEPEPSKGGE